MSGWWIEWAIAAALIAAFLCLLPSILRRAKASARGKGRLAGASLAIGMVFSGFFEPAKRTGSEQAQKGQESDAAERDAGSSSSSK
jgi:hypothetical protein